MRDDQLYDPIRGLYVLPQPEEVVRQNLIGLMLKNLKYPKSLLAVEKDLFCLPHLENLDFPSKKRRLDIVCFAKDIHPKYPIYPLLIIECKAFKLDQKTVDQVLGYNHFVKSYFVSIANKYEIKTFWYNIRDKKYDFVKFLPTYDQLIQAVRNAR